MTEVVTLYGADNTPYLTRVILGRLRLHVFHRGDADPDLHDHPADFLTFPLVSYAEVYRARDGTQRMGFVQAFRLHRRRAEYAHRVLGPATRQDGVISWSEGQIATIVWWGNKRREWGFQTANGWVPWRTYIFGEAGHGG